MNEILTPTLPSCACVRNASQHLAIFNAYTPEHHIRFNPLLDVSHFFDRLTHMRAACLMRASTKCVRASVEVRVMCACMRVFGGKRVPQTWLDGSVPFSHPKANRVSLKQCEAAPRRPLRPTCLLDSNEAS